MSYSRHGNLIGGKKWYASTAKDIDETLYEHDQSISEQDTKDAELAYDIAKTGGIISRMNTFTHTPPTDKVWVWVCEDDDLLDKYIEIGHKYGLKLCHACIADRLTGDEKDTVITRCNTIVANGGEILAHSAKWTVDRKKLYQANYDADDNRTAYNTLKGTSWNAEEYANLCCSQMHETSVYFTDDKHDMYDLFVRTKEIIEGAGFPVHGAIKAGSGVRCFPNTSITIEQGESGRPDKVTDDYVRTFYDWSDYYGQDYFNETDSANGTACYYWQRTLAELKTASEILSDIDTLYNNISDGVGLQCVYIHGLSDEDAQTRFETICAGLKERADAGKVYICTPYEYWQNHVKWKY